MSSRAPAARSIGSNDPRHDRRRATLGRALYSLLRAKWLAASGRDPADEARRALAGFRESRAPWWTAKSLRLLGEAEEAREIERALGIPSQ